MNWDWASISEIGDFYKALVKEAERIGDSLPETSPIKQISRGELVVFDYAPNLTIVGAHHCIDDRDKEELTDLVMGADFVAIESCYHRLDGFIVEESMGEPFKDENALFCDPFDKLYLDEFHNTLRIYNERLCEFMNKSTGRNRTTRENEQRFSRRLALAEGKEVYFVDVPWIDTLHKFTQMSLEDKWGHIASAKGNLGLHIRDVRKILFSDREEYMLAEIERLESPFESLQRKGILVCGSFHALNYFDQMKK